MKGLNFIKTEWIQPGIWKEENSSLFQRIDFLFKGCTDQKISEDLAIISCVISGSFLQAIFQDLIELYKCI